MTQELISKIAAGERINTQEAVSLFKEELALLSELAQSVRKRKKGDEYATFIVDLNLNITNQCICHCDFCAFYKTKGSPEVFVLTPEQVLSKAKQLEDAGGTQILLQGGINTDLKMDYYVSLLRILKRETNLHIHALSPPEICYLAETEGISVREVLQELRKAGLDSLPGGGAEILVERVRATVSPKKISGSMWLETMRQAHGLGMKTTATMMFGHLESLEERVDHLRLIRELQDQTGGFRAFIPWSFSPANTRLSNLTKVGGGEYLKTLAISRIFLDNIDNIGSGWLSEGMPVAQLGLLWGANDMGGILMQEEVMGAAGVTNRTNIDQMVYAIQGAGFTAARRNTAYEIVEVF